SDRHASALALLHRGRPQDAERALRSLLQQAHVRDEEYDEWLRSLVETYRALGRQREAGCVMVYLHRFSEAHAALTADGAHSDAARARELWARAAPPGQADALFLQAAREYDDLGLSVHAAIAWTAAGAHSEALRAWERVAREPRTARGLAQQPYEQ